MPVFISHSHEDADFVDKLAVQLIQANAHVWVDRWELSVGDSLIDRIESAIQDASALIVVLSTHSVASAWCKKEINAGLIRELDERRVVVLPLLLEDCDVPVFLKDKLYADFRTNFDKGLNDTLTAIAKVTSDVRGRIEEPDWHFDWAMDWWYEDDHVHVRLITIEAHSDLSYTMLSDVVITPNKTANARYTQFKKRNLDWVARHIMIHAVAESLDDSNFKMLIENQFPHSKSFESRDPEGFQYKVDAVVRMVGQDTGMDLLFNIGRQIRQIDRVIQMTSRRATANETVRLQELLQTPAPD